jgi:hypothetical protein
LRRSKTFGPPGEIDRHCFIAPILIAFYNANEDNCERSQAFLDESKGTTDGVASRRI